MASEKREEEIQLAPGSFIRLPGEATVLRKPWKRRSNAAQYWKYLLKRRLILSKRNTKIQAVKKCLYSLPAAEMKLWRESTPAAPAKRLTLKKPAATAWSEEETRRNCRNRVENYHRRRKAGENMRYHISGEETYGGEASCCRKSEAKKAYLKKEAAMAGESVEARRSYQRKPATRRLYRGGWRRGSSKAKKRRNWRRAWKAAPAISKKEYLSLAFEMKEEDSGESCWKRRRKPGARRCRLCRSWRLYRKWRRRSMNEISRHSIEAGEEKAINVSWKLWN